MKNLIMMMAVSVGITVSACAQVKVPAAVKSSFDKEYPGTKVKWEKEGGNYEAGFEQKGHEMSVIYTPSGMATEKEMEIKVAELPQSVKDYVSQHMKGAKIKEAAKITKSNGEVQYEAEVNGKDILFTPNGGLIKSDSKEKD
jgi:outer membrane receptor for ferric coprogen and ferric-rhodotorulic acid